MMDRSGNTEKGMTDWIFYALAESLNLHLLLIYDFTHSNVHKLKGKLK